jgi:hypothetical protein
LEFAGGVLVVEKDGGALTFATETILVAVKRKPVAIDPESLPDGQLAAACSLPLRFPSRSEQRARSDRPLPRFQDRGSRPQTAAGVQAGALVSMLTGEPMANSFAAFCSRGAGDRGFDRSRAKRGWRCPAGAAVAANTRGALPTETTAVE